MSGTVQKIRENRKEIKAIMVELERLESQVADGDKKLWFEILAYLQTLKTASIAQRRMLDSCV
jgi:hypothetical protein